MVAAASVSHGQQRESVHFPRQWCLCACVGFQETDPRPWKTVPGKRLRVRQRRWTGSSAAYEVVDEADALGWMSALM